MLKTIEWVVSAYTSLPNAEDIIVLRIVIKENINHEIINNFIED